MKIQKIMSIGWSRILSYDRAMMVQEFLDSDNEIHLTSFTQLTV
jgi:hypothetical protein